MPLAELLPDDLLAYICCLSPAEEGGGVVTEVNYNYDNIIILAPIPGRFQKRKMNIIYTSLDPRPLFTKRPGIEASMHNIHTCTVYT